MILVFLIVLAAGLIGTFLQQPVFRATGLLEIRPPSTGVAPSEALASSERISAIGLGTERGLLHSPALARRVVEELELHRLEAFRRSGRWTAAVRAVGLRSGDVPSEASVQGATARFLDRLVVHPKPESRLVEVSFDFEDPEMATRIVNATLSNYSTMRLEASQHAVGWLDAQLDSVRSELDTSERRLRAYVEEHALPHAVDEDLAPEVRDRIRRLRDELADARAARIEAEALVDLVVRTGDLESAQDRVVEQLSLRLSELRREYAELSSTFTPDYPEARPLRHQIEALEGLLEDARGRVVRSIESRHRLAQRAEAALWEELQEELRSAEALGEQAGAYHPLRYEVLANRELFASLQRSRGEARVLSGLEASGIGIVDWAVPPEEPHRPVLAHNLMLALLAGLVLGIGTAFLREYMDDTVRTGQELGLRPEVPVLALIPSAPRRHPLPSSTRQPSTQPGPRIDRPVGDADLREMMAEAFGILRTGLLFGRNGAFPRSLLVTSSQAGEGKSTVALNLALSVRRLGRRVLLVDADQRRSGLSRAAGVPIRPGLADHLRRGGDWRDFVQTDKDLALKILSSGGPTPDAGALLSLPRFNLLLAEAEREYDLVIVDSPALFVNAPDAHVLAELVTGVLIVVRSEHTSSSLLDRVLDTTPNVMGIVINDLNVKRLPSEYRRFFAPYGRAEAAGSPGPEGDGHPVNHQGSVKAGPTGRPRGGDVLASSGSGSSDEHRRA